MPCGTLLQTGSYSMTSTRDAERHPYFFYSKTLVNTEKMLESTDFACTLKETKTTIPISRTPKPISGFGLKPGRYRPSAVKVAGFDPLDANHAASTGVGSFPVLDRTCKQGKENTGMKDNQTTRRMPMIVTAMACATASMLAGLALAPSAMAADTTITLQGADGASLAGHTFDVYRIGTYTDQILNGTRISSLGVRGDTASNAWAADAIGIANAYDPGTGDDIAKVYGYDDAGNIANIKMDSQTRPHHCFPRVAVRARSDQRSNTTSDFTSRASRRSANPCSTARPRATSRATTNTGANCPPTDWMRWVNC